MARKADQVISDVMEGTRPDRALSILSSAVMVAGIALPFLSVVLDLETTPAIVVVSVGLFFSVRRLFHKAGRMETGQRQDGEEVVGDGIHQRPDHPALPP